MKDKKKYDSIIKDAGKKRNKKEKILIYFHRKNMIRNDIKK